MPRPPTATTGDSSGTTGRSYQTRISREPRLLSPLPALRARRWYPIQASGSESPPLLFQISARETFHFPTTLVLAAPRSHLISIEATSTPTTSPSNASSGDLWVKLLMLGTGQYDS